MKETEHIQQLVDTFTAKGYTGTFVDADGKMAPLDILLGLHLYKNAARHAKNESTALAVGTITDGIPGKDKTTTACTFLMRYDHEKGFEVQGVSIDRYEEKNKLAMTVDIPLATPKMLPPRAVVNSLAKAKIIRVQVPRSRHGFNLN